jgi:hypothetical protein
VNSQMYRRILLGIVALAGLAFGVWLVARQFSWSRSDWDIHDRTKKHAAQAFDSIPRLPDSKVVVEWVWGNLLLRTADVNRLSVTNRSAKFVCAFYISVLIMRGWGDGLNRAPLCQAIGPGYYRLFASSSYLDDGEPYYQFILFVQDAARVKWSEPGLWVPGIQRGYIYLERARRLQRGTLISLEVGYVEDPKLRHSPCDSWEDSSCDRTWWESTK